MADQRVHGTRHERLAEQFERDGRATLRPLPAWPLPTHGRRFRGVANDSLIDTVATASRSSWSATASRRS
jgi:hypothetical protein